MTPHPEEILAAARGWVGTPYRHRAATRGAGADCLGLLRGIWEELYSRAAEIPPPYSPDWTEATGQEHLWAGLARNMVPRDGAPRPGDVLLFRMRDRGPAKHLGIMAETDPPHFIHAYYRHGVVESALSGPWARRIVAQFGFPDRRG